MRIDMYHFMNLHSIDYHSLLNGFVEENHYMRTSRVRNVQDCLVYLAWINRLWNFYFRSAIKNFRWLRNSVSHEGELKPSKYVLFPDSFCNILGIISKFHFPC